MSSMFIDLDDLDLSFQASPAAKVDAKFFQKELTGSGGAVGLLNKNYHPGRYPLGASRATQDVNRLNIKRKITQNSVTLRTIPMDVLTTAARVTMNGSGVLLPIPAQLEMFEVTEGKQNVSHDVFLNLVVQGTVLTEDGAGDKIVRSLETLYRMELYVLERGASHTSAVPLDHNRHNAAVPAAVYHELSYGPMDDVLDFIQSVTQKTVTVGGKITSSGVHVDEGELALWMSEFDVYSAVVAQAERWNEDEPIAVLEPYLAAIAPALQNANTRAQQIVDQLHEQIRFLETYPISLSAYRGIHTLLGKYLPQDITEQVTKHNINLLMDFTLEELNSFKSQLVTPPPMSAALAGRFSKQQAGAVCTDEPLVLVQAGAGTGKSTVILGRIDNLVARGVAASDITVLSFTNAAADNIKAKNSSVGSMTIARMIHDIYEMNFPTHQLSSIETIINSLDIFYPQNDLAREFRIRLNSSQKNEAGCATKLNTFVEENFDGVMMLLDRLGQTCLELEIIVAYQKIDTLSEPKDVQSRYLIIDEVQDNSIFEFIYLLKYVAKHKESLFIVGDASQTLFEFRSSNPKALNALEESGVFATYQLTTNYRSNQEVLDFANVHLIDIKANHAAQLQLRANALAPTTATSFQEKVELKIINLKRVSEFRKLLPAYVQNYMVPYIDKCIARGEKVAFLSFAREDGNVVEEQLRKHYPQLNVVNITPERSRATTLFSEFVKKFWDGITQLAPANAPFGISQGIDTNLAALSRGGQPTPAQIATVKKLVQDWWMEYNQIIKGWLNLLQQGVRTTEEFFEDLRQSLLDFEISRNAARQAMLNVRNRDRKDTNAQAGAHIIISTIHSAKGLEFDNTIVLHRDKNPMDEPEKRMYYVAFTRAMNTELVLSYGNERKPRIESDYLSVVEQLTQRDHVDELRKQGIDISALEEDEAVAAMAQIAALHANDPKIELRVDTFDEESENEKKLAADKAAEKLAAAEARQRALAAKKAGKKAKTTDAEDATGAAAPSTDTGTDADDATANDASAFTDEAA